MSVTCCRRFLLLLLRLGGCDHSLGVRSCESEERKRKGNWRGREAEKEGLEDGKIG